MGRHADHSTQQRLPELSGRLAVIVGVVLVLVAGGIVWFAVGSGSGGCAAKQTVRVTVTPEVGSLTGKLLAGTIHGANGLCVQASVTSQQPLQTLGSLRALQPAALPEVWVPDSSLWAARAQGTQLTAAGSLASSDVVLATSRQVATGLGWLTKPPSWAGALTGDHPLAVPDLTNSAVGLTALAAVRTSLGGNADADKAVVAAVLAAARGPAVSTAQALAKGRAGDPAAPLVPVTEQQVLAADGGDGHSSLTAIYPTDGSPRMDYPILTVGRHTGADGAAVTEVVRTLTSSQAQAAARAAGFRTASGGAPAGAGGASGVPAQAPQELTLAPTMLSDLLGRIANLAKPSRLLTVIDVSTSMSAQVGNGTRATLARDATKSALALLPDTDAVGLWDFAYKLGGPTQDWQQLAPIAALNAAAGNGLTQRQAVAQQLDSIPTRLAPGGTALYDTTLAAVRAARADFDPNAVNSVVLITDGKEDDDNGITLPQLLSTLKSEADPSRPVKVVAIGLGPDADVAALRQIADATGGASYQALNPQDLESVLFDAIRRRG